MCSISPLFFSVVTEISISIDGYISLDKVCGITTNNFKVNAVILILNCHVLVLCLDIYILSLFLSVTSLYLALSVLKDFLCLYFFTSPVSHLVQCLISPGCVCVVQIPDVVLIYCGDILIIITCNMCKNFTKHLSPNFYLYVNICM